MKRQSAFTLLEALITVFLVALVLGSLLTILQEGFRVNRMSITREKSVQAAVVGLDRMVSELREAVALISPVSNAPVGDLTFQKVDASAAGRLVRAPDPATFSPLETAFLLEVHYFRDGSGNLVREVRRVGGSVENRMVLAQNLAGLNFSKPAPHCANISFTADNSQTLQPFATRVAMPCCP